VHRHPAVDIKLRRPWTALALAISALAAIVMFAKLFLLPIYMEELQGLSVLVAGLALLPHGLVTGLGTVLGDRLGIRWGIRRIAFAGMLILSLATAALLLLDTATAAWETASQLPPAVRAALGEAAIASFHDTILLLVAISAVGCLATLLLRSPRRALAPGAPSREESAAVVAGKL
jgi:MFS family permease